MTFRSRFVHKFFRDYLTIVKNLEVWYFSTVDSVLDFFGKMFARYMLEVSMVTQVRIHSIT